MDTSLGEHSMKSKRIRYGLKTKLIILFIAVALIPSTIAISITSRVIMQTIRTKNTETFDRSAHILEFITSRPASTLERAISNALSEKGFEEALKARDVAALKPILKKERGGGFRASDILLVTDMKGKVIVADTSRNAKKLVSEITAKDDYSIKNSLQGKSMSGIAKTSLGFISTASQPIMDSRTSKQIGVAKIGNLLTSSFLERMKQINRLDLIFIDTGGNILSSTFRDKNNKALKGIDIPAKEYKSLVYLGKDTNRDLTIFGNEYISHFVPMWDVQGRWIGMQAVCIPKKELQQAKKLVTNLLITFCSIIIPLIGFGGFLIATKISSPIQTMNDAVHDIIEGNLDVKIHVRTGDEIEYLADAFNHMTQVLKSNIEKLKELDRLKTDFLNTVSHELRTPLTSIKAFSELLLDNSGEDLETQVHFLNIINEECDRLTRLITELLDLSRIESGRMQWNKTHMSMAKAIRSAIIATKSLVDEKGLTLVKHMPSTLPGIDGDFDKIEQVIINLLSNAVKFTDEGGRIEVRVEAADGWVNVSVADTGVGIPADYLTKVFDKFQQVEMDSETKIPGTGLGLAIVKNFVEGHHGEVWVESEPGKGSTFYFKIPVAKDSAEFKIRPTGPIQLPQFDEQGKKIVLIVDDEPNIRLLLRKILETSGYHVIEASSGAEAIEKARICKPSLITLDIMMPELSGYDVLAVMKNDEEIKDIPVIVISITEEPDEKYSLGIAAMMPKPIDRGLLVNNIRELIGKPEDGQKPTVMVVDDEPSVLEAVTHILDEDLYHIIPLADGDQVLDALEKEIPDLIILDIIMPGKDGLAVLRDLKQHPCFRHIPVVILSASTNEDHYATADSMGAAGYFTKPFSPQKLEARIVEMIEKHL